jgi:hypothetical protein
MSNILDQNGVSFIPVNRKLTVGEIVDYFCDFLQKRKTPIDIYENTKILDFTLCYAPSYLVLGEFDFSWIAKLTFNNETSTKTEMTPGSGTALLNGAEIQERFGFFRSMYNDGTDVYVTNTNTTSSQMDKGVSSGGVSIIVPCNCNELSAIDDKFYPTVNEINSNLYLFRLNSRTKHDFHNRYPLPLQCVCNNKAFRPQIHYRQLNKI